MGYNTVAFILNDLSNSISRSPQSAAWLLANPPMSESDETRFHNYRRMLAERYNEPVLDTQALCILPTFHSSESRFLFAGGNLIEQLQVKRFGKDKATGRRTVTLILPEWWNR